MLRKILFLSLIVLLILSCSVTAYAQYIDPDRWGSISVTLTAQDEPVAGAELNVYYVASAAVRPNDTLTYAYTEPFESCDIPLDDPELSKKLSTYVVDKTIPAETLITDAKGEAVCDDLPHGLYLIKQIGSVEGFSVCSPFLVTVPMVTDSEIIYDVNATPKTDIARLTTITIKKVWLTDESTKTHDSVTVQLLHDDVVVETAILNDANSWQISYKDMPESDAYSVQEVNVPQGFTPIYEQDGDEFTVFNVSSLAQTGQRIWPIPVLALAGLLLLMLGFVILRKPGKTDA